VGVCRWGFDYFRLEEGRRFCSFMLWDFCGYGHGKEVAREKDVSGSGQMRGTLRYLGICFGEKTFVERLLE